MLGFRKGSQENPMKGEAEVGESHLHVGAG